LRVFCCFEQDDWASLLNTAEFAYNDSVHASTRITPFQAYTGRHPSGGKWPIIEPKGVAPKAKDLVEHILQMQTVLKHNLHVAQQNQSKAYDKSRTPASFKVGDWVWLSTENFRRVRPKKKLDYKYDGPFKVIAQVGSSSYRLDLKGSKAVHPVFPVSLLEPFQGDDPLMVPKEQVHDNFLAYEGDDVYQVDRIEERRQNEYGVWEYKVIWKDYPMSESTWEVAADISDGALRKFNRQQEIKPSKRQQKSAKRKSQHIDTSDVQVVQEDNAVVPRKRGRGRPPNNKRSLQHIDTSNAQGVQEDNAVVPQKRGRGRPPKKRRVR
jgi:hypothetical protein